MKLSGADTGAEKKKSNSPATAPGTEKLPVTVTEAALDGAVKRQAGEKPSGQGQKNRSIHHGNSWEII